MSAPRVRIVPTQVVLDTTPLTARHWAVFAAGLLLAIAAWWINAARISTAFTRVPPPAWYPIRPEDDEAHVFTRLASGAAHAAAVLVVGTSVAQASLWTDEVLSRDAGLSVVNLSTRGQSLLQALYVLYAADLHPGQVVVVVTNPGQWTRGRDDDWRLTSGLFGPVASFAEAFQDLVPGLDAWLEPGSRGGLERGFQRQWLYRIIYGGLRHWSAVHLYGDLRPIYNQHRIVAEVKDGDPAIIENSRAVIRRRLSLTFERDHEETTRIMNVLLRFVTSRGAQAVLLDSPRMAGDSLLTYGSWWPRFRADELAFADSTGRPIVDMNPALALSPTEFRDAWHLAASGRDRWSRAFVQQLALWCPAAGRLTGRCR